MFSLKREIILVFLCLLHITIFFFLFCILHRVTRSFLSTAALSSLTVGSWRQHLLLCFPASSPSRPPLFSRGTSSEAALQPGEGEGTPHSWQTGEPRRRRRRRRRTTEVGFPAPSGGSPLPAGAEAQPEGPSSRRLEIKSAIKLSMDLPLPWSQLFSSVEGFLVVLIVPSYPSIHCRSVLVSVFLGDIRRNSSMTPYF